MSHGANALLLLVVILVVVVIVADIYIVAARRRRSRTSPVEEGVASGRAPLEVTVPASPSPPAAAGGLVLEEVSPGTMVWRQSTVPAPSTPTGAPAAAAATPYRPPPPPPSTPAPSMPAPPTLAPPPPPPPTLRIPPAGPPTPTGPSEVGPDLGAPGMDAEEAALAREEREVMRALTQLPQGLPTTLWGWDMAALARAVLSGERKTLPDGTEVVNIKDRWYNADRTNVGRFMREHKEPVKPKRPARPAQDREEKLDLLERALLEGKISEETYKELKAKYEK